MLLVVSIKDHWLLWVKKLKGQALTDGPSIDQGELALGQNVLVAYIFGMVLIMKMQ